MVEESVCTIRDWLWEYEPCWLGENRNSDPHLFPKEFFPCSSSNSWCLAYLKCSQHKCTVTSLVRKVFWTHHSVLSASFTPQISLKFYSEYLEKIRFLERSCWLWKQRETRLHKKDRVVGMSVRKWLHLQNKQLHNKEKYLRLSKQIITNVKLIKNSFFCPGKCICSAKMSPSFFFV